MGSRLSCCVFVFQDEGLPLSSYEFPMKKVLRQGWSYIREHQEGFGKSGRVCDGQEVNTAGVVQFLNWTHKGAQCCSSPELLSEVLGPGSLIPCQFCPVVVAGKKPLTPMVGGGIWTQAFMLNQGREEESRQDT